MQTYKIHEYRVGGVRGVAATVIGTEEQAVAKAKELHKAHPDRQYNVHISVGKAQTRLHTIGDVVKKHDAKKLARLKKKMAYGVQLW